jgi:hypothetical protein
MMWLLKSIVHACFPRLPVPYAVAVQKGKIKIQQLETIIIVISK